ncbi:MAG: sigma-54-dependent Fis family transcriptional regulator [Myxococcales bacterium]|nr:sigma-54-dependent Fis family transcriptional regulator [Myxococcales bacterium]
MPATHRDRVLVVDDEDELRYALALNLGREGFEVIGVPDGRAALVKLEAEPFDAILCDLVMPGLDGLGLLDALRARKSDVPVVLMSAHADVDTALAALAKGATDYLQKPFRADEVRFRLRKAIEQRALSRTVARLEEVVGEQIGESGIIARSEPMQRVFRTIRKVADYKTTVLLTGESGTGKELVARALHFNGARREKPYIAVNCGAIPQNLLESELFGHVRGAFTDATRTRRGLFEEADGGTLFLDEIGELPGPLQVKLLRVLQEGEIRRVGETKPLAVDVRVVAATVRDLPAEVKAGRFREDLFYRLNVLPITLPPLRARPGDIPLLVEHFIARFNERLGTRIEGVDPAAMKLLLAHAWPGNVRELENTIERAMVLADGAHLTEADLPDRVRESQDKIRMTLRRGELSIKKTTRIIEEELIRRALTKTEGNRTRAAELLEISHRALLYKIKEYEIDL